MNIVTDPMMGLDMRPGATIIDAKKLSFCANESCLDLDKHAFKCSGCKVSIYSISLNPLVYETID
jgi:hypothetical protein